MGQPTYRRSPDFSEYCVRANMTYSKTSVHAPVAVLATRMNVMNSLEPHTGSISFASTSMLPTLKMSCEHRRCAPCEAYYLMEA